jgi:uncharacterized Zn finger protein
MDSVADLVTEDVVRQLAMPANFRLGQEIASAGEVRLEEFEPLMVRAHVGGKTTQPRNVTLQAGQDGLTWYCSCVSKKDPRYFCKHLVAAALETRRHASERRA